MRNPIDRLKKGNVYKACAAYLFFGWVIIDVSSTAFPALHLPNWTTTLVVYLYIIGLPVVVAFAWVYDQSPSLAAEMAHRTGWKLNLLLIASLTVAVCLLLLDKFGGVAHIAGRGQGDGFILRAATEKDSDGDDATSQPATNTSSDTSFASMPSSDDKNAKRDESRRQRERELAASLASVEEVEQLEAERSDAQLFGEAISKAIEENWSLPPAYRGMSATLRLQLEPTGHVVQVSIVRSSGNKAFDASAIDAVRRAKRFSAVADAPPQLFERHLRSMLLTFDPEDSPL